MLPLTEKPWIWLALSEGTGDLRFSMPAEPLGFHRNPMLNSGGFFMGGYEGSGC
jgi:hypothetical protein